MRFTLHGSYDNQTEQARQILEKSNIPYRLERVAQDGYDGELVLVTPAGRFSGLTNIESMFG